MMRENDQTQRMKSHVELLPERKTPISTSSNIPLMAMTPVSATVPTSTLYKDLTSTLFEQKPSQPLYSMSTSQTMPSLLRPTIFNPSSSMQQRPTSNTTDLTSSLMNNMNSLASRPQTTPTTFSLNSTNTNSSYFNSGTTSGGVGLFQPPPPPGSTVFKNTNTTSSKTASAELDDLFN
jgi:hypothetical protein